MRQTKNSLFLQLIRVSLGNAAGFSSRPSAKEWEELMAMSSKQGVAGVAFSGVEKLPKEQMPSLEVIMDWSAIVDYIEMENRRLNRVNVKVCDMFERDGKRVCIVKGASVGVLYPEPLRRDAGDVDVWMAGGREAVSEYVRGKFADVDERSTHHASVNVDGVCVEVHFLPAELYSIRHFRYLTNYYRAMEATPWNCRAELDCGRAKGVSEDGMRSSIVVPQLQVSLVTVIVHLFHHWAFEGVGMKQVLDCYWLLKQVDKAGCADEAFTDGKSADEIRSGAMMLFRRMGIRTFVAALMYVLKELGMDEGQMLCKPNARYGKRLLDSILATGIVSADELANGKYGQENRLHKFFRRAHRVVRMMPMAPSEMIWMLLRNVVRWLYKRDLV